MSQLTDTERAKLLQEEPGLAERVMKTKDLLKNAQDVYLAGYWQAKTYGEDRVVAGRTARCEWLTRETGSNAFEVTDNSFDAERKVMELVAMEGKS